MTARLARLNLGIVFKALISGMVLLGVWALFINISWFDEPLHPELVSMRELRSVSMEGNAYVLALGFAAAQERSPQLVGRKILEVLRVKHERGQSIALTAQESEAILGGSKLDEDWQEELKSLTCNARRYLNCAEQLIAEMARADVTTPRLSALFERYSLLLEQPRFEESQERDVFSPMPPYQALTAIGRLRLAKSYERESIPEFLSKAGQDFKFWLRALREGETLATKMVSLAGIQNDLDFLSTLMRHRELTESDHRQIQAFLRPLTREESNIAEALISEARIALLSGEPPILMRASWLMKLMSQENATSNEDYMVNVVPMLHRASLSAEEYYRQKAYEPLMYQLRLFPAPLYNLGGRLALSEGRDAAQFPARVHDQNGRILLVLLQSEIERRPASTEVSQVINASEYRDPYTGKPMTYDVKAQTIGFKCVHTIFHPPDPPDVCAFPIGPIEKP
ncbi:hypothetical protein [Peristeroidobacter agariperforans]|uniref:hypothetical protein n=1 Tax=Peristeroidobacter agariperforans TaxID=268404 RepID=UPI00101C8EC3|nr:hypothetical protein [Peristeroidobacter agariperforans]